MTSVRGGEQVADVPTFARQARKKARFRRVAGILVVVVSLEIGVLGGIAYVRARHTQHAAERDEQSARSLAAALTRARRALPEHATLTVGEVGSTRPSGAWTLALDPTTACNTSDCVTVRSTRYRIAVTVACDAQGCTAADQQWSRAVPLSYSAQSGAWSAQGSVAFGNARLRCGSTRLATTFDISIVVDAVAFENARWQAATLRGTYAIDAGATAGCAAQQITWPMRSVGAGG